MKRRFLKSNLVSVMIGPLFWDILDVNGGPFPSDSDEQIACSFACWYVARNLHIAILEVPAQVTLEGDTDVTVNLKNVMRGAIQAYGLDPDDGDTVNGVMRLMPLARRWAFQSGRNWNSRVQAWVDSGGYSYNVVTREPDAI